MKTGIQKLSIEKQSLIESKTVNETKIIINASDVYADFLKKEDVDIDTQNEVGQFRIDAYCKLGEQLDRDYPQGGQNKGIVKSEVPNLNLANMPVDKKLSMKAREINKTKQGIKDSIISEILNKDEILTPNKVYEFIRKFNIQDEKVDEVKSFLSSSYGENMFFNYSGLSENRRDDWQIKDYNKLPTLTTIGRFFHPDMSEFGLREYANVQEFPNEFKFVGTYSSIKKQIGNAVSPTMGRYVTSKLKGKTCGDLFAGCGGFTCGAEMNDIKSKWAIEWNKDAAITYQFNYPDVKMHNQNIKHLDPAEFEKVDIIIGGPPCQGFSTAGLRFKDDPRNELYKEFVRFVSILKPNEFIMENVPQIADIKDEIIEDFEGIGYNIETMLIKGGDIGMKQNRKRFFFVGRL